jgi:hypothetical protein
VLPILTQYFLRYRRVSIPHVGTFQLVPAAPELNVADKEILPPAYLVQWQKEDTASEHQLSFIQQAHSLPALVLEQTGRELTGHLNREPYLWPGIGLLRREGSSIVVTEKSLQLAGFLPVTAQKVLRENAVHQMLVGDRETDSQIMTGELARKQGRYSALFITAVILLVLALATIVFFIFNAKGQPAGAMMQEWWK